MGQAASNERPLRHLSHEEVAKELANKFARKCYTPLELLSLKDVFHSLAGREHQVAHLKQHVIAQFLGIPDSLNVSAVLFQMMSSIAAFPFLEDAPAIIGLEQLVIVVTILTRRYRKALASTGLNRRKLIFRSLAVYDRQLSSARDLDQQGMTNDKGDRNAGSSGEDAASKDDGDDDDPLALAALKYLECDGETAQHGSTPFFHSAAVPADSLRRLIMLLLLTAPLDAQESLAAYAATLSHDDLDGLRQTADCVLESFLDTGQAQNVMYARFDAVMSASMPFLLSGLTPLFERFLFSKNLDFHGHTGDRAQLPPSGPSPSPGLPPPRPLLEDTGSIMNVGVLSQLSFFIPGTSLFRCLRLLYSGDEDGYSMGSFETKVFNWRAPTILLVRGIRLDGGEDHASSGPASAFLASLPSKRFPPGNRRGVGDETLTFGVYLSQPWKHTHRECFGTDDSVLFQLSPVHDVFRASTMNKDYASFIKPSAKTTPIGGISFGCPPPHNTQAHRRSTTMSLGPVSLALEDSFEFGCFTHNYTMQGGAFQTSGFRKFDFQDRFEISSLEVWGCGGDEEAKHQAERWAWEAREAEARRRINLGTGDIEADRALLEMAGLIGTNRSGGSMG
ncbi:hypothetical protein VTJ83DRAFT_3024 [Remersonia thermophila]|uniref:Restriction of telomere capping protein 5 n=1 Tax=Remersonia thermophila TaxID=72144 RepID=A0ABR4DCV5_9PEZI